MSAAKATGSAWKLPPDSAVSSSAKISGLSVTPLASSPACAPPAASGRGRRPSPAAGSAGNRGPARADRRRQMRGADLAARHQRAQAGGDVDLAAMAAQRMDARIERRVRAARRVGRKRAGRQRRLKHALDLEQAAERIGAGELRAVQQRQPLLRLQLGRRQPRVARARRRPACARRSTKTSPTPIIAAAICASGARSPEAPTEPCAGTTGSKSRCSIASISASVCRPHARGALREARELQRHHQPRRLDATPARRRRPHGSARCCVAAS